MISLSISELFCDKDNKMVRVETQSILALFFNKDAKINRVEKRELITDISIKASPDIAVCAISRLALLAKCR